MLTEIGSPDRGRDNRSKPRRGKEPLNPVPPGSAGGQYRPLTEGQVRSIHDAAVAVLEETGIQVFPSPCREVWRRAGARIDDERNRVFVPSGLITRCLSQAASTVRLCGQVPEYDLDLADTRVYLGTGGAAVKVLDLDGHVRESRLQDLFDIGRLIEALDHIHFYLRPVVARDIGADVLDINTYYASLVSTRKHVMGNCFTPEAVRQVTRLAAMISGTHEMLRDRPLVSWVNCWTISPLRYAPETVETLDEIVHQGMPVVISSAPQAGATSPATLAGTLVQLHAEQLSGITYINLLNPGHPIILGYVPSVADLRTGAFSGGSPEFALMNAAAAQLAHHLGLPVYNSSGLTDSKVPDIQAGYEKGISSTVAALAGANFIHHSAGFLESMLTVAYEQYVIDNEINGSVMRLVRGIEVTNETLAVDVIHQVCFGAGNYLSHPQTLDMMRSEYLYPSIGDRSSRDDWERRGALDARERARTRARELLNSCWPNHISDELDANIRSEFDIRLPPSVLKKPASLTLSQE